MSAAPGLLEHLGVVYEDVESLVASTGPRVADAVAGGDDVYLSVDRRTARAFRDWLGPAATRVEFPSPASWLRDVVRDLRSVARPDRRTLVLGQYPPAGSLGSDHTEGSDPAEYEAGINLVLGDRPLTVICTCAHDAGPSPLAVLRTGHPQLLVDGTTVPNPDYRTPPSCHPVTCEVWGPPTLRLDFRAPDGLHRVREHVTRVAEAVGLRGEAVDEAVLATHEAAVLAAGGLDPSTLDPRAGEDHGLAVSCVLEVRADTGALHCEVRGPRPEVTGPPDPDADPLRIVRRFCDRALLHDEADVRSVRVLRTPDPLTTG